MYAQDLLSSLSSGCVQCAQDQTTLSFWPLFGIEACDLMYKQQAELKPLLLLVCILDETFQGVC